MQYHVIGAGPEGEPFSSLFDSAANKNIEAADVEAEDPNYAPVQHYYMKVGVLKKYKIMKGMLRSECSLLR